MVVVVKQITSWKDALNAARCTIGKKPIDKEPSDKWKKKMILAEHSPIRLVEFHIEFYDIPSFVMGHLVRHHEGCEKFVCSNREDRSNKNPETINRLTPVNMQMRCNMQSLINISRKRLCNCASKETKEVWEMVVKEIEKIDPIIASKLVPECIYRGFCPEFMSNCKYSTTNHFKLKRLIYAENKEKI